MNGLFGIKRLIGDQYADDKIKEKMARWTFIVVDEKDGRAAVPFHFEGANQM